jgi:hypothetical protein
MQKPVYFENQIIKKENLDFLNNSLENTIKGNVSSLIGYKGGIANGLNISATLASPYFNISNGIAFTADGEKIEVLTPITGISITKTGTAYVYGYLNTTNIDPLTGIVKTNINPITGQNEPVEQYNILGVSQDLPVGISSFILGSITSNSLKAFISSNTNDAEYVKIAGFLDVHSQTISGTNILSGTLNSNSFINPLTYDINLGSNVNINLSGNNNIGTSTTPLNNIYSLTGTFHEINGMSPINIDSLIQKTGTTLEAVNDVLIDTLNHGTKINNLSINPADGILFSGSPFNLRTNGNMLLLPTGTLTINAPTTINNMLTINNNETIKGTSFLFNGTGTNNTFTINNSTISLSGSQISELNYLTTNTIPKNLVINPNFSSLKYTAPNTHKSGTNHYYYQDAIAKTSYTPLNWTTIRASGNAGTITTSVEDYSTYTEILKQTNSLTCFSISSISGLSAFYKDYTVADLEILKPNTTHNVSFNARGNGYPINLRAFLVTEDDYKTYSNNIGLVSNKYGITDININGTTSSDWEKYNFTVTTPNTNDKYKLIFTFYNTTGVIYNFLISSVQITEGITLYPTIKKDSIIQLGNKFAYSGSNYANISSFNTDGILFVSASSNTSIDTKTTQNGSNPSKLNLAPAGNYNIYSNGQYANINATVNWQTDQSEISSDLYSYIVFEFYDESSTLIAHSIYENNIADNSDITRWGSGIKISKQLFETVYLPAGKINLQLYVYSSVGFGNGSIGTYWHNATINLKN